MTSQRLTGLDIARFAAFTGMVLVNFRIAAQVAPGADWASTLTNALEGRAAALFVVLAGIGFSLARMNTGTLVKRAAFLMALGLLNQTIFEADILHFYALYFLAALPFAQRNGAVALAGAAGFVLAWLILAGLIDYETGWDWQTLHYADFWTLPGFLRHALFNGWHPVIPWAGFFLVGMWAGGLQLGARRVQLWLALGGAGVAAGAAALSRLALLDPGLAEIATLSPIPPGPFYMVAAAASALSAIGLILLGEPLLTRLRLAHHLAAPGRMSLSLYIGHILIGMGAMEALGWLDGRLSTMQVFGLALGFCLTSLLFARAWLARWKRGPLEALMRRLT